MKEHAFSRRRPHPWHGLDIGPIARADYQETFGGAFADRRQG